MKRFMLIKIIKIKKAIIFQRTLSNTFPIRIRFQSKSLLTVKTKFIAIKNEL